MLIIGRERSFSPVGPEDDDWLPKFASRGLDVLGKASDFANGCRLYARSHSPHIIDLARERFGDEAIEIRTLKLGGDHECGNWLTFASLTLLQEL